jgi:hypothetical protein
MSIPVYSTLFINSPGLVGDAAFLVPDGYIAVVRDIDAVAFIGAGATLEAGIGGGTVFWAYTWSVVAVVDWRSWRGRVVLSAGQQLVIHTDAAVDVYAGGYLLTAP